VIGGGASCEAGAEAFGAVDVAVVDPDEAGGVVIGGGFEPQ
jgi:hypothetical protein